MPIPRGYSPCRGFTLLELLVALAIFAVLAAIAYGALNNVLETGRYTALQAERLGQLQIALWRVERDLSEAAPRPIRDEYGERRPAMLGGGVGATLIELTRDGLRNPIGAARSSLQRVAYVVQDKRLVRLSWSVLDRAQDSAPLTSRLLDGVERVEVRFLDRTSSWQDEWPGQLSGGQGAAAEYAELPRAVEISFEMQDWGRITRLIPLPEAGLQAPPASAAQGGTGAVAP